ncbi:DUF5123 domain-containing protein [Salmonirosea aquatica]|uniref:DUF5123 domain-containing protein n=1 Tax=Salmonirosea aquatica TaxID=2654236 RepID=A0A7C9BBZ7_9BACT|nr:DUF5123 domain-containing protein [Cytophagaceae bacterium SJW1-29]
MKNKNFVHSFFIILVGCCLLVGCKEDEVFKQTRLFSPVLNKELSSELNTIIVNMGKMKQVDSYTIEVSRDTFRTVDYTITVDTNYVVLDEATLNGDPLFWNTLYQLRAKAHASDPQYDSKVSDLGNVRTQKFPSVLLTPAKYDVIDNAAKVRWQVAGLPVTAIKVFAGTDLKLTKPLRTVPVPESNQKAGEIIIEGLDPLSSYQLAIYSGNELRGWEVYKTMKPAVDLTGPNVVDLSKSNDSTALATAVSTAAEGAIIVLKKGVRYLTPTTPLNKSITITSAYGFGEKLATMVNCNWNIADGSSLNTVKFSGIEIIGGGIGSSYIFNPNPSVLTTLENLIIEDCIVSELRGVLRIRSKMFITNYTIQNSIIHRIGGYGILTTDTDGEGMAAVDNILLESSTFSKINMFMTSRQNTKTIKINNCTMSEVGTSGGTLFNWRGTAGVRSNVTGGISITNTVWGHAWDEANTKNFAVRGIAGGLEATNFSIINTYATSDFAFVAGSEIAGFPSTTYNKKAEELWISPYTGLNFGFKDAAFPGRRAAGDPRWRIQ